MFGLLRCNGGVAVRRNPVDYKPYLRTLVAALADTVRPGGRDAMPDSALFDLQPTPPAGAGSTNPLPGVPLLVPSVEPDTAQPLGGVRFAETELALGRPLPVALSPVGTRSINDLCGNWGGWQPFTADELTARYGSVDAYLARYAGQAEALVADGYLLASEVPGLLAQTRRAYLAAPTD